MGTVPRAPDTPGAARRAVRPDGRAGQSSRPASDRSIEDGLGAAHYALARVLQSTSIPLFVLDARHVVVHWNRACENLTGVAASSIVGTRQAWKAFYADERPVMADLVVDQRSEPEIAALYGQAWRESATLPGACEFEALFPHFGTGGKWLFCTTAPLRDDAGRVVGAIETFQDITQRKRAEAALRESEERLQTILDAVQAGILLVDAESHEILEANSAALRMCGATAEQVVGHECHQTVCPAERGRCPITDLHQSVDNSECTLLSVDKGALPILKTVAIISLNSRPRLLETFVDISARKVVEEELQRRIAELSEAKRRLEVLVSHTTDRERRMVDLKQEVNDLLQMSGRGPRYQVPRLAAELSATPVAQE